MRHRYHVLNAMIAIRRIRQRPRLVDDADARLLGFDRDPLDVPDAILHHADAAVMAHSTAVCAWNSAGKEIWKSTFSMT